MKDKLIPKEKFPMVLGCSALLIALCAAFFSVYGIATLFAGASISAMVMATTLEIGKLTGTTFLYRYWNKCTLFLKVYLTIAILVLMTITSLGIFGYLSSAYQKSSIEFGVTQDKITNMENQKKFYYDKIDAAKKRIDDLTKLRASQENRMSQILTNEYISRNPVQLRQLQQQNVDLITDTDNSIKDENKKIQDAIDDSSKIDQQVNDLKLGTANKKDVQTFKFVADALHMPLDKVVRWFILSIITVFDPLAICLILAYNIAVYNKKQEPDEIQDDGDDMKMPILMTSEPVKSTLLPTATELPKSVEAEPVKVEEPTPQVPSSQQNGFDDFFKRMFKIH